MITLFASKSTSALIVGRSIAALTVFILLFPGSVAQTLQSDKPDPALGEAVTWMKKGELDVANTIYEQYLRLHPTSLDALLGRATIALRWRNYDMAETLLKKAWGTHPDSSRAAAALGEMYITRARNATQLKIKDGGKKDLGSAAKVLNKAIETFSNSPEILTSLGNLALQDGDLVSAERDLKRALVIKSSYVPAYQGLIYFYLTVKDNPRAQDAAMHALELDPNDPMTYFLIAKMLANASDPGEAVRAALRSEKLDFGRMPERNALLAAEYDKLGDAKQAIRYYRDLVQETPNDPVAWQKLADLQARLGETHASTESLRQAVALNPLILEAMARRARSEARNEHAKAAKETWRRILEINPGVAFAPNTKLMETKPGSDQSQVSHFNPVALNVEARGMLAGLSLMERFQNPAKSPEKGEEDRALLMDGSGDIGAMDLAKLDLALSPEERSSQVRSTFQRLQGNADPAIAGEASFLLEDMDKTQQLLDAVDGLSEEDYVRLADRLFMDQELVYARVFYQRAYELNRDPGLMAAIGRIEARQEQAKQKIVEGNALFSQKLYAEALVKYRQARVINRQSDTVYLRLGDTHEQLKQWFDARQAYDTAVALSPSLLSSPGFAKHYDAVKKRTEKSINKLR